MAAYHVTSDDKHGEYVAIVPYVPWRCPKCGARHPRTTGQHVRIRYHRCQSCGLPFRSLEIDPDRLGDLPELRETL